MFSQEASIVIINIQQCSNRFMRFQLKHRVAFFKWPLVLAGLNKTTTESEQWWPFQTHGVVDSFIIGKFTPPAESFWVEWLKQPRYLGQRCRSKWNLKDQFKFTIYSTRESDNIERRRQWPSQKRGGDTNSQGWRIQDTATAASSACDGEAAE